MWRMHLFSAAYCKIYFQTLEVLIDFDTVELGTINRFRRIVYDISDSQSLERKSLCVRLRNEHLGLNETEGRVSNI